MFDPLRAHPRFLDLVRRVGIPETSDVSVASRQAGRVVSASTGARVEERSEASIAVLPFVNLSPDPDDAYFSDGLTEELITDLSRIENLRVVSSASAFRLKGTHKDLRTLAEELRVTYVVSGRVRKSARDVRITAQLVDARDDTTIWADKYSGRLGDVFALQEQVSSSIAHALQLRLAPPPRAPKPAAVEAFLKARHFFRQTTGEGFEKALDWFERATRLDPDYAPAFAGVAQTCVWISAGWSVRPPREMMPRGRAAAQQAVAIAPGLPEAHVALGLVATYHDWDPRAASAAFTEALRLNPNYGDAHKWYSMPLIWLDTRFDEALEHVHRAIGLDPVDPSLQVQCLFVHYFSRNFEEAIAQGEQTLALDPLYGFAHYALGTALATAGRPDAAIDSLTRSIQLDGLGAQHHAWLGCSHAILGNRPAAIEHLTELENYAREGRSAWAWQLTIHAALGDSDAVMRCLEEAFAERSASLVFHLTHPLVDCVRGQPRFNALLRRMRLEHLSAYAPRPAWRPGALVC
jgi:TolB-like protein/lipoprotein NlpI